LCAYASVLFLDEVRILAHIVVVELDAGLTGVFDPRREGAGLGKGVVASVYK
jgi:hypothetical protein